MDEINNRKYEQRNHGKYRCDCWFDRGPQACRLISVNEKGEGKANTEKPFSNHLVL